MKVFTLLLLVHVAFAQRCLPRNFGHGSTVCVCNMDHCDILPRAELTDRSTFLIYTSNKAGLRFEQSNGTFSASTNNTTRGAHVNLDPTRRYQSILGFGGAFTDAAAINFDTLPRKLQIDIRDSYYSRNGAQYTIGRVPIGGTDFSTRAYSYDDGPADPTLQNFRLQPEDYDLKMPHIKGAMNSSEGQLRLFGSAWTAPRWMKTNDEYNGFGVIEDNYLQTWADYHLRFVEEYSRNGIDMWGITTGNEPLDSVVPGDQLEVVAWPAFYMQMWIKNNLGPTIRNSSFPNLKIMMLDDQRGLLPWYPESVLDDNVTRSYVDGIAVHWYLDWLFPANLLSETHSLFPEKFILGTEACNGYRPTDIPVILGSWERGESYATDIMEDLKNWAVGWTDWNLALNMEGGPNYNKNFVDSPIIVNPANQEFYKQPMFYHLAHFSKNIPRDSRRIHVEVQHSNVNVVAFRRPDEGTTVVLLNKNKRPVTLDINDPSRGQAQVTLSERSITTVVY